MSNAKRDRVRARARCAHGGLCGPALSLFIHTKYEDEREVEATKVGKGR